MTTLIEDLNAILLNIVVSIEREDVTPKIANHLIGVVQRSSGEDLKDAAIKHLKTFL